MLDSFAMSPSAFCIVPPALCPLTSALYVLFFWEEEEEGVYRGGERFDLEGLVVRARAQGGRVISSRGE
jgi:hypothetical protein